MRLASAIAVVLALGLAGCGGRPSLDATRARLAAERTALDDSLDELEERLLADQARVRYWREMRERHESVSAVACKVLDGHAEGMALLQEKQREKRDALARKHRVAARFVPPADVEAPASASDADR
jgi:hypothetical protein